MKTIKYLNPKTGKYQTSKVLSIENDVVSCLNVKANYPLGLFKDRNQTIKKLA